MKFARVVYWIAAVYGIIVILPLFFMEEKLGIDFPPPVNHPEYLYAFAGITLVWQILFIFVASDPIRLRPIMIPTMLEKLSLVPTFLILVPRGLIPPIWYLWLAIDLLLGSLFLIAYRKTRKEGAASTRS